MDRLKRLLNFLADGENLSEAWLKSGYLSKREAAGALRSLALSYYEQGTGDSTGSPEVEHADHLGPDERIDRLIVHADGASKGNPGPSAVAAVAFLPSGEQLTSTSKKIGRATNNIAEYRSVLEGLQLARMLKARDVTIRLDSELVVKQLNGIYRIKNKALRALAQAVIREASCFHSCAYEHVPRDENKEADRLANSILKGKKDS